MRDLIRGIAALLAPARCAGCGARGAQPWCPVCAATVARLAITPACRRCGSDVAGRHGCWPSSGPVRASTSAYRYRGVLAGTVVAGKARGAWAVWRPLGERLAAAVGDGGPPTADLVTWVPTEPRRARARGIDHARELAVPVGAALGVPVRRLLATGTRRADQAARPTDQRRHVPPSAFRALGRATGARVLLVDDVLTTGGTVHAAAGTLLAGGAAEVRVATLARAGDHRLGRWDGPTSDPPEQR